MRPTTTNENDLCLTDDEWLSLIKEQRSLEEPTDEQKSNKLTKKQTCPLSHFLDRFFSVGLVSSLSLHLLLCITCEQVKSLGQMIADERHLSFIIIILFQKSKKVLRGQKYIAFIGVSSFVRDHCRYDLDHFSTTIRELSGQSDR